MVPVGLTFKKVIDDECREMGRSDAWLKGFLAEAQVRVYDKMLNAVEKYGTSEDPTRGLGFARTETDVADNVTGPENKKMKVSKMSVQRVETTADEQRPLHYWGKVIPIEVAAGLSKPVCVPMGNNDGVGPRLFIDGRADDNLRRSCGCLAWAIPPLLAKDDAKKTEKGAEAEGNKAPPAKAKKTKRQTKKKRRQAAALSSSSTEEDETSRKNKKTEPVGTHEMDFEPVEFIFRGEQFKYFLPFLKIVKVHEVLYNVKLHRARIPWGEEVVKKQQPGPGLRRQPKEAVSFVRG